MKYIFCRDWLEGKVGSRPGQRVRSASAGRDKRTEMAARYWAVLFENLRRAVDDLYRTCEGDESCIAAREVSSSWSSWSSSCSLFMAFCVQCSCLFFSC